MLEKWSSAVEGKKTFDAILTDLSEAFVSRMTFLLQS